MGANGSKLSMDYSELENTATRAQGQADQLDQLMGEMTSSVQAMCDGWTASASPVFLEDYKTLAVSANNIAELVRQLSDQVKHYVHDMQELDTAYSSSKLG